MAEAGRSAEQRCELDTPTKKNEYVVQQKVQCLLVMDERRCDSVHDIDASHLVNERANTDCRNLNDAAHELPGNLCAFVA